MPELCFRVEGAEAQKYAAEPSLTFFLRVSEAIARESAPTSIHSVALRCQIRIEPAKRHYNPEEKHRLRDLFGSSDRWGQTLRPMLWTHLSCVVPPFSGERIVELSVPCSFDFCLSATRYFSALQSGDLPLCFLFSGTIFYEGDDGALQVTQISWEKEATFRLSVACWQELIEAYHPGTTWLCVRKELFDQLDHFKSDRGLTNHNEALEQLLLNAKEAVAP